MGRSKLLLISILGFFLSVFKLNAQDHRFMVFFQDKSSSFSIDNPLEFLSTRAIERRFKQNISITEQDLPINQDYLTTLEDQGAKVWFSTKWLNGVLIQTDSSKLADLRSLSFVSSIEYVAPGPLKPRIESDLVKKNQPLVKGRTQSTEIQNMLLGIDAMHQEGITGKNMLIAVFDGGFIGVDNTQPFEHIIANNQLITTYDFVGNSSNVFRYDDHGTKVLSVIGANNQGIFTGSAFEANYMLCITEDVSSEYRVEEYNWLFAAEMADSSGVDIINTSLGYNLFDDPIMNYRKEDLDGSTPLISIAASIAATKGMVLTISAGNSGNSSWQTITPPADALDVLVVGAIRVDSSKAIFSSTGPSADGRIKPDIVALGVSTAVINRNGNTVFNNGTSFSAPQIAGLAAGVWQQNPEYNYLQVIESIKNSGHTAQNPNNQIGHGIPNYLKTKSLVLSIDDPVAKNSLRLFPNPFEDRLSMISEMPISKATLFIYNVFGQKIHEQHLSNIPGLSEVSLSLPPISPGVYLVTVISIRDSSTFRLLRK